ncbi:MAG: right-handed parallel beta-helix repeat-containing protein [Nitrososphaeraceae archaeon]
MNRTVMTYMLATIVALSTIAGFSMQPLFSGAQAQVGIQSDEPPIMGIEVPQGLEIVSPSCGQVIDQSVKLTSNLNCDESDALLVGQHDIVINLNGYTLTGPGDDSSKVGIMVPNHVNVVIANGTINGFQAGILASGADNLVVEKINFEGNQIGVFATGSTFVEIRKSMFDLNDIGIAAHSTQNTVIEMNQFDQNQMAGITLVNTDDSQIIKNNIGGGDNGVYIDNQSNNNEIAFNNVLMNLIDFNNANGLPVNTNANNFGQNNCMISNPSGICVGG